MAHFERDSGIVQGILVALQRRNSETDQEEHQIAFGVVLDIDTHECTLNDNKLSLTPTEFSILWVLYSNRGRVISSEELFHEVWGDKYFTNSKTVFTVVLPQKQEKDKLSA